jgi:hypothetical protein
MVEFLHHCPFLAMAKVCTARFQFLSLELKILEVIVKNPADFIGSALGQSESQTKAILASTVGKVLVIDEVRFFTASV